MPSVNVAMERSLREGAVDLLAASLRPLLDRRAGSITDSVGDVKTAFSSWDNCMNFTYCKWPVIAVIIVGGLIIFSVVWCLVRCLCCGLSCCCECFYCLKCCGNCCGCCDTPKGTPHKHLDDPYQSPNQGYRSQAPMYAGPAAGPKPPVPLGGHEAPKYAEFDVSKPGGAGGNEDSLPAMPSWEGSTNTKVVVEEPVELEQLKKPEANLSAQGVPLMSGASPVPASPVSPNYRGNPYGGSATGAVSAPYLGGRPGGPSNPYAGGYNSVNGEAYGQQSAVVVDQAYDGYGAAGFTGQSRGPPGNFSGGYGQVKGYPGRQGPPGRQGSYDNYGRGSAPGYGAEQRYDPGPVSPHRDQNNLGSQYNRGPNRSPAPHQQGGYGYGDAPRRSPAPQAGYGYEDGNGSYDSRPNYSQRQHSSESTRPLNPEGPSQGQYSGNGRPQVPSSPIYNTGGYARDHAYEQSYESRPKGLSPQNTGGDKYPGYQAYQPAGSSSRGQQAWNRA